jgi:NADPH2:quinone reductase
MTKAIRIYSNGGPETLKWEDYDPGQPGKGEVLIRHEAIGLNFIDVYHRTGLYPLPSLPAIPGMEAAGIVEAVGEAVTEFKQGDRVAYAGLPTGAYAQTRLIPDHRLITIPDSIESNTAAAMMLKGMTARYLIMGCYAVKPGDTILVQAAAGGVGSIVSQWANDIGATVIGTVGSQEKAELAKANGCHYPILYNQDDFVKQVREITNGEGVAAVYDSVGQATFMKSLDCLKTFGMMVSFGQSSGSVPPFDLGVLAAKGSLFLTRPSLMTYTEKREDLVAHAKDLFDAVERGAVAINIGQEFPLSDAAEAHRHLEGRKTTGSTILIP